MYLIYRSEGVSVSLSSIKEGIISLVNWLLLVKCEGFELLLFLRRGLESIVWHGFLMWRLCCCNLRHCDRPIPHQRKHVV